MAKKRDQIKLTRGGGRRASSRSERVMNVATNGRDGWPHVTALWFVMRGAEPWIWTYRKSQKVKNLERDDRATLLVESGHEYAELKGVMLKTRAHIEHDTEQVLDFAEELFAQVPGRRGPIDEHARGAARAGGQARRDPVRGRRDRELGPREARRRVLRWSSPTSSTARSLRGGSSRSAPGSHQSLVESGEAYAEALLDASDPALVGL